MLGVVGQYGVIEFRDQTVRRPVPELEDRGNEADPRHVLGQAAFGKQIECGRMRGRGARIGLQAVVVVKQPDRNAPPAQDPRAQQADRPATRDQHPPLVI